MSRREAVGSDGSPLVGQNLDLGAAHIDHGFNGECHAGFEFGTTTAFAEIWHLGIFVELATNAVTDEFTHDAETIFNRLGFHKIRDVANAVAWAGELHSTVENFFRNSKKTLNLRVDNAHRNGRGIVTNPAVTNDADVHLNNITVGYSP